MTEDAQTPAKNPAKALCNLGCRCLTSWSLTPAEQDVANFTVKGYSISEIAQMRTSAEATIKTHRNAIWRKAGLAGRGQPVSLLIEDLLHAPIIVGTDVGGHASPVGSAVRN